MSTKLYVGGLPYSTKEDDLKAAFAEYGEVASVRIIEDRETGRSRGFGFVEMATAEEAQAAIDGLNETDFGGRKMAVNIAREKTEGGPRREGGFRSGGNHRGGGNYMRVT